MNAYIPYCLIILLGCSSATFSQPVAIDGNFWQCSTKDGSGKEWTAKSVYKKIALNFAYDLCKNNSTEAASCKSKSIICSKFVEGVNIEPFWECTALDREAMPWKSTLYSNRDDAALAAKAYCRQNSSIPETCYINLVTCMNINEI